MLGLLEPTDPRWVEAALADFDATLLDHLHCELKAASNATALVARYPMHGRLVRELSALAQEELSHVVMVHAQMEARGVTPKPPGEDPYAVALRKASLRDNRNGAKEALVDRLTVAALIEARSCERFAVLREHSGAAAMRDFYDELFASEARHHRIFASLAEDVVGFEAARARLNVLAEREAEIARTLPVVARVH